jgi:ABC-type microcin C transport system duplicated ATPase subunit YejF
MIEKLIAEIEQDIASHTEMREVLQTLPSLEGLQRAHVYRPGNVILTFPYDLEAFQRNRAILETAGFTWDGDLTIKPSCGEVITDFTLGALEITVFLDPDVEGSTCQKSIIGYENKPVYEVICKA